jgi:hypothetical protein
MDFQLIKSTDKICSYSYFFLFILFDKLLFPIRIKLNRNDVITSNNNQNLINELN